jgi:hypothetical protein
MRRVVLHALAKVSVPSNAQTASVGRETIDDLLMIYLICPAYLASNNENRRRLKSKEKNLYTQVVEDYFNGRLTRQLVHDDSLFPFLGITKSSAYQSDFNSAH